MTRPLARIGLVASCALLVLAAVLLLRSSDRQPRADLLGSSVTAPSVAPTTVVAAPRTAETTTTTTTIEQPGLPRRIQIPSLGVDATVVDVGLESDGSMQLPGASESGWYWPGVRPGGEVGSAVIAAHVDYAGERGVFFDLRSLEVGSEVSVVDDLGDTHLFIVTERFQVDKAGLPIDELFRVDGTGTLTLITCGGVFDQGARSYTDNIVVRAVPV